MRTNSNNTDGESMMVTRAEACDLTHMSVSTLKRLEKSGKLTPYRPAFRDVRYLRAEVMALVVNRFTPQVTPPFGTRVSPSLVTPTSKSADEALIASNEDTSEEEE